MPFLEPHVASRGRFPRFRVLLVSTEETETQLYSFDLVIPFFGLENKITGCTAMDAE